MAYAESTHFLRAVRHYFLFPLGLWHGGFKSRTFEIYLVLFLVSLIVSNNPAENFSPSIFPEYFCFFLLFAPKLKFRAPDVVYICVFLSLCSQLFYWKCLPPPAGQKPVLMNNDLRLALVLICFDDFKCFPCFHWDQTESSIRFCFGHMAPSHFFHSLPVMKNLTLCFTR